MASEQLKTVIDLIKSRPIVADDPLVMRARMEDGIVPPPADVALEPVDAGGVPAEWTLAPGARSDRLVVYFHGGGYCGGSIATHRSHAARLSRLARVRVLNVGYRLAPEHPHPAAVEDALAALRFAYAQGFAPERLALAGDSAGGGLVLATLVALRDARLPLPACAVCLSPWTDMTASGESIVTKAAVDPMVEAEPLRTMARAYVGGGDPRAPLASPLFADLHGLPPLLIHVGSAELLLDDATRLASRARAAGVDVRCEVWEDMIHVWHVFGELLPEAMQAMREVAGFLEERLASPASGPSELAAIEQIKQLKARYFRLMDTKQWEAMREVFAKDARLVDEQSKTSWTGRDAIIDGLERVLAKARTVHHGHMPEIQLVSATEARGVWSMNDWVDTPELTLHGWGHYHERYVLEDGAWRIADERISRLRVEVVAKAPRPAAKRAPARKAAPKARPNKRGGKRR